MTGFTNNKHNIRPVLSIIKTVSSIANSQNLDDFKYNGSFQPAENAVSTDFQFNGYTNYWHDIYRNHIRYGNLFKIAIPNVDYTIAQSNIDIAEDMQRPPSGYGMSQDATHYKNLSVVGWGKWEPGQDYNIKISVRLKNDVKASDNNTWISSSKMVKAPYSSIEDSTG